MWRRSYLLSIVVRLYFAIRPSYLHPDEHFQGPEVIAGRVFNHVVHETWEFAGDAPIRSVFPLWPVYGLPMLLLKVICGPDVSPQIIFNVLRLVMFGLCFVLEDWALYELIPRSSQRKIAIFLVASCYVTWTWQVHTFSNALETILVLWSLVLIKKVEDKTKLPRAPLVTPAILGVLLVSGTFTRITFPAFVLFPFLRMIPKLIHRPFSFICLVLFAAATAITAALVDTAFYSTPSTSIASLIRHPIITPLNNFLYNSQASNLALHGTHPFYQHALVNLPQLLGPAYILLVTGSIRFETISISGLLGALVLSIFSHQEARFLLPVVPLILSSLVIPPRFTRFFFASWIVFNTLLGVLMGIYHQGGVVPVQVYLGSSENITQAFWWKTYSPPTWLLGSRSEFVQTVDLMGLQKGQLQDRICMAADAGTVLVAPSSAVYLDRFTENPGHGAENQMQLVQLWKYKHHLNLDDMDFGDDGFVATLQRVVGRRGLVVWSVRCPQAREPDFVV